MAIIVQDPGLYRTMAKKLAIGKKFSILIIMDEFWNRVKTQVKAHKISMEKFAEYLNIPRSTFYGWQQFNIYPEVKTAYHIAAALGVSVEYLVTGRDGKSEEQRMKQTEQRKTTEEEVKKLVEKLHEEVVKF